MTYNLDLFHIRIINHTILIIEIFVDLRGDFNIINKLIYQILYNLIIICFYLFLLVIHIY